jgi:preprotein translocase subunit SecB
MKNSPLQLKRYFVTELSLTANKEFDPKRETKLGRESIIVTPSLLPDTSDARQWQVTLRIQQQPGAGANPPYFCALEIVGFFRLQDDYPEENIEWMVQTNGTSVLFSAAREILRGATALGPYPPILLPTVSFYGPNPRKAANGTAERKAEREGEGKAEATRE